MSEKPTSTGMGTDEPVGSTRMSHRSRNIVIWGGLALVLVAGVILAGVIPTGDRAGTTTSDPSPSASATVEETTSATVEETTSATASPSASATVEETTSATASPSASASVEETTSATASPSASATASPSASATVEETACADGGECQVGDVGPGGGTIIYVDTGGFGCGEVLVFGCTTLEAGSVSYGRLCSAEYPELYAWSPGISSGEMLSFRSRNKCRGGLLTSVRASTDGGMSDWFVGSTDEVDAAIEADVLGINFNNKAVWTVDQGSGSNRAVMWFYGNWASGYGTTGEAYVIPIRAF